MRCVEDQIKDNIVPRPGFEWAAMDGESGGQGERVEKGEEKPVGKFVRLKIKKAKRARLGERESAGGEMDW